MFITYNILTMKIKVKLFNPNMPLSISTKGEWIDLRASQNISYQAPLINGEAVHFYPVLIPLGIAMELPKYFEANILPRSSTFSNYGFLLSNSMGIIDSSYKGDTDCWKFQAVPLRGGTVFAGDRIAQFRIRPSQFAPWWVKLKWLFTSSIQFEFVSSLGNTARGGFGSTGIN